MGINMKTARENSTMQHRLLQVATAARRCTAAGYLAPKPLVSQHNLTRPLLSTSHPLVFQLARHKMSTAHRPTWDPAQAREVKGGSRQYSVRDMAAHTKLKFRCEWL